MCQCEECLATRNERGCVLDCEERANSFFFKQKTAYEMRISDWSSDVCSSDLKLDGGPHQMIRPGATWRSVLPIRQPAATLWYHSHVHGRTAEQVYAGLAGILLVTDDDEKALGPGAPHAPRTCGRRPRRAPEQLRTDQGRSEEHKSEIQTLMSI